MIQPKFMHWQQQKKQWGKMRTVIIIPTANPDGWGKHCVDGIQATKEDLDVDIIMAINYEGFALAINQTIPKSPYDFLCLLNDDTEPQAKWLHWLLHRMTTEPDIGIVGAKLYYPVTGLVQHAGTGFDKHLGEPIHDGRGQKDSMKFSQVKDVFAVSFAAALLRKEMIDQIGLLDESFKYFFEDIDYCIRAREAGWRVVFEPSAKLVHYESMTIRDKSKMNEYNISKDTFLNKWETMLSSRR